jgi:hypothetical protein
MIHPYQLHSLGKLYQEEALQQARVRSLAQRATMGRPWWLLWVGVLTLALVLASLLFSQYPAAAQDAASEQQFEEATFSPIATASPTASEQPSAPPSAQRNDPGTGSDPGPIGPSFLPGLFSQEEEPERGNTAAPSVPQAAEEGLRSGLNEVPGALNSLVDTMTGLPFAAEQTAKPRAETNMTTPQSATQDEGGEAFTPIQEIPRPNNAPGSSEVTEVPSAGNLEPASDPNGDQASSGTTKVTDCEGQAVMLDDRAAKLLRLHNEIPADHGLEPFCVEKNLMTAAQGHA